MLSTPSSERLLAIFFIWRLWVCQHLLHAFICNIFFFQPSLYFALCYFFRLNDSLSGGQNIFRDKLTFGMSSSSSAKGINGSFDEMRVPTNPIREKGSSAAFRAIFHILRARLARQKNEIQNGDAARTPFSTVRNILARRCVSISMRNIKRCDCESTQQIDCLRANPNQIRHVKWKSPFDGNLIQVSWH